MNTAKKGSRQERKCKAILEKAGYVCTKTSRSLGVFDIIAENPLGIRHIQVKSNRIPEPVEREGMINMRKNLPRNCTVEFWVFYDGNTTPRIEYL